MKRNFKSTLTVLVSLGTAAVMLAGCSNATKTAELPDIEGDVLPVKEPVTLTAYKSNSLQVVSNYSEMGCYEELEKKTGVKIVFEHPVAGQETEQFNIMLASGEYPDLIFDMESKYSGGLAKACQDGIIYKLNDMIDKYAPNITQLFEEYPQLRMEASDDQKSIYAMPMVRGGNITRTYRGPIIRQDYLDKFGLQRPETIEDWHTVLTAFKNGGIEYPFTATSAFFKTETFVGAYGLNHSYILKDGQVKWSPYEDAYKDYVQLMADWYREGLIDMEITTNTQKVVDSKVLSGTAGALIGTTGNSVGGYAQEGKRENPSFDLAAVLYPVLNRGDKPYVIQRDKIVQPNLGVCISTSCKNLPVAMAYIDYAYGKDGHMLFNFGVEGESYAMQDGYPKFTDTVTNNPEGLSMAKAGSKYALAFTSGPFVQDTRYAEQFYSQPRQLESLEIWGSAAEKFAEQNITVLGSLNGDESSEIATIENNLKTYANEMFTKWVLGQQSMDNWDEYKAQLKKLGVERAVEIKQNAYERYIKAFPELAHPQDFEVCDFFWSE